MKRTDVKHNNILSNSRYYRYKLTTPILTLYLPKWQDVGKRNK